jgi:hypothetical protein
MWWTASHLKMRHFQLYKEEFKLAMYACVYNVQRFFEAIKHKCSFADNVETLSIRIHQRIHCNVTRMHQFAKNLKRKKKTSKITMWKGTQNFLGPWGGNTLKADSRSDLRDTRHGVKKNISYAAIDKCTGTVFSTLMTNETEEMFVDYRHGKCLLWICMHSQCYSH